jgi:hypothetical protein
VSLIANRKKASDFYADAFRDSEGGSYYLGFLMCYFIGLSNMKKGTGIRILKPRDDLIPLTELDKLIAENKIIYFAPLDQKTFERTYNELKDISHFGKFVKRFDSACRELGILDKNIFFSKDFMKMLLKNTMQKKSD